VDENEISGTIVNPCSSQFMLRMGSSNGGAMPVTANSSHVWKAGETYALRFAYRFAAAGSDLYAVNKLDVLEWVQTVQAAVPVRTDHRPIISLFLSQTGSLIDPNTVASKFSGAIQSAQQTNSGGIVVWDVEGTKYASYTGDPRIIPAVNPASLPALDQAFANARAAGLSVGVCIRDCYIMTPDKSDRVYPGAHNFVPRPYANETERRLDLFSKIAWSIDRWQITRVYLDSWAGTNDKLLFLAQSFPDVIISPETQYPGPLMYAVTQPYIAADQFRTQTPASIKAYLLIASGWEYIGNVSLTSDRLGGIYAGAANGDILGWRGVTDWPDGKIISEAQSRGYW
jgi:hypothetical protein